MASGLAAGLLSVAGFVGSAHADQGTVVTVQGAQFRAADPPPPSADFPIGDGGNLIGWSRYSGTNLEPSGFDAVWNGGSPLLLDANGEQSISLLSDWFFLEKSTYLCLGKAESWEFKVTGPAGQSYDDQLSFDASCDFFYNGSQPFVGSVSFVEFLGSSFSQHCNFPNTVGVWTLSLLHNGLPVDLTGSGITTTPRVMTQGRLMLSAVPGEIATNQPASLIDAAVPGGQSVITASVVDPVCGQGVPNVPLNILLEMVSESGGHNHQMGSRVATPVAGEEMVLQPITAPSGTTYNTGSGVLVGPTDSGGEIVFNALAGQVSGQVDIVAIVAGQAPPGIYGLNNAAGARLGVVLNGLEQLGFSTAYELVGSNVYPPPGQFGANHDENHYVSPLIHGRLLGMAQMFQQDLVFVMEYNDNSLQNGGLFDVGANFMKAPGHVLHRAGLDQDINEEVMLNGNAYFFGKPNIVNEIRDFVTRNRGRIIDEPPIHVRFSP